MHCLERYLELWQWHHGDITALVKEGKCIQDHLHSAIKIGPKLIMLLENFTSLCHWVRLLLPSNFFPWMPRVFYQLISKYPVGRIAMVILHGNN